LLPPVKRGRVGTRGDASSELLTSEDLVKIRSVLKAEAAGPERTDPRGSLSAPRRRPGGSRRSRRAGDDVARGAPHPVGLGNLRDPCNATLLSPCSSAWARSCSDSPWLIREMVSSSVSSRCQRPTSGKSAWQGPQFGSVKTSSVGLPDGRREPVGSPRHPGSLAAMVGSVCFMMLCAPAASGTGRAAPGYPG
jgi:hypothetical protein